MVLLRVWQLFKQEEERYIQYSNKMVLKEETIENVN